MNSPLHDDILECIAMTRSIIVDPALMASTSLATEKMAMKHKVIQTGLAVSLSIGVTMAVIGPANSLAENMDVQKKDTEQVLAMPSTKWRLSSQDTFVLQVPMTEGPTIGQIKYLHSGHEVSTWRTNEVATMFYSPVVLGSFPRQFVVIPYLVGGGTGYAVIHWGLIHAGESQCRFTDMGFLAAWSYAKTQIDFQISPCLVNSGDSLLFEFQYIRKEQEITTVVKGKLILDTRDKNSPVLIPATLQDAMTIVQLLDSPLEAVQNWARTVILRCVPADIGTLCVRKQWNIDDADLRIIDDSLRRCFPE